MTYLVKVRALVVCGDGSERKMKTFLCLVEATDEAAAIRMTRRHLPFGIERDSAEIAVCGVNKFNFLEISDEKEE